MTMTHFNIVMCHKLVYFSYLMWMLEEKRRLEELPLALKIGLRYQRDRSRGWQPK